MEFKTQIVNTEIVVTMYNEMFSEDQISDHDDYILDELVEKKQS